MASFFVNCVDLKLKIKGRNLTIKQKQQELENAGFHQGSVMYLSPDWNELREFLNLTEEEYKELGFIIWTI